MSGGWFSSHEAINASFLTEFLKRGYTVFAVVHGSQPKFTIPEVLQDMHRAVRYIRHHAADYGVDPQRIGISGGSAGGHLSLMQGTAGTAGQSGGQGSRRSRKQPRAGRGLLLSADRFLELRRAGRKRARARRAEELQGAVRLPRVRQGNESLVLVTDEPKIIEIGKRISPVTHVTSDDPPTLIIHGDADKLVPIQQADLIVEKLKAAGVPAEVVVKKGAAHGWPDMGADMVLLADWFDKYLAAPVADEVM